MIETVALPVDRPFCLYANIPCSTKQYADELETLLLIQQAITSRLELSDVLQLIAEAAQRLTSAQLSLLYVLEGDELCVAAVSGQARSDNLIGYRIPVAESIAGSSIQTSRPIIIPDAQNDPRICRETLMYFNDIHSYLAVPLLSEIRPIGVIVVANQETSVLGTDSLRVLSMLASSAVIGLENARMYQEQQQRRLESEERYQMAESLRVMLAILNSNRSPDEILNYIVTHVSSRLLDCQAMAIYCLQPGNRALTIQAAHGLPADFVANAHFLPGHETVGQAVLTGQPVAVPNAVILSDETRVTLTPAEWAWVNQLRALYQAWLAVPLIVKGDIYGAILMCYRQPRTFFEEEIGMALAFSDQVALAIENAWLRTQAEQAAVMAERNRLARELHDAVSQTLFSTSLIAEVLPRMWDRNQAEGRQRLEELRQLTRGALAEMRTLLFELRPAALKEAQLGDLLKHLTQAITGRSRIPISLVVEGDRPLPPEVKVGLYRITQEALNNVVKYANPSQVIVSFRSHPEHVELTIGDDGCGFDPSCVSPEHLGLGIMYERAAAINAMMKLKSSPGHGTQIEVFWSEPTLKEQP